MQSEHYVEYSEDGRVIKGQEKAIPRTKYVEDALENNHKGIWGSYFDLASGRWVCVKRHCNPLRCSCDSNCLL